MAGLQDKSRRARLRAVAAAVLVASVSPVVRPTTWADEPDGNLNTVVDSAEDGVGAWVGVPGEDGSADESGGGGGGTVSCWLKLDKNAETGEAKWVIVGADGIRYGWFFVLCDGVVTDVLLLRLDPTLDDRPAAPTLAEQAYKFVPLTAPQTRLNPSPDAAVGLRTWLWVDPGSWGERTMRVGVTGLSVVVRARAESVTWTFGDAETVVCRGPGTAYDPAISPERQHTDCAVTFRRSSAGQPHDAYPSSATTTWRIRWAASDGTSGELPPLRRTTRFPLRVVEVQTIVTSTR